MTDEILQAEALAFKKRECVIPVRDAIIQSFDLTQDADELSEISRTVENSLNAYVAIESYVSQFMKDASFENWTRERATQYHRGMAGILLAAGINLTPMFATASFEAISTTQTREENLNESKEKATNLRTRIWEAIKAAIAKFLQKAPAFIKRIGDSGKSIAAAGEELKAKISGVSGEPDLKAVIKSSGWGQYLMVGTTATAPARVLDSVRVTSLEVASIWIDAFDIASKAVGALATRKTSIPSSSVWSGLNDLKNMQKAWPGAVDMKLEGIPEGSPTIESMNKTKIKLVPVSNAADPQVVVLDKNACNSVATSMKSLGDAVVKSEAKLNKLLADMKAIESSLGTPPAGEDSVPDAVKALPGMITSALDGPQVIYPYAAKIAQGAYRHVEESLKRYK